MHSFFSEAWCRKCDSVISMLSVLGLPSCDAVWLASKLISAFALSILEVVLVIVVNFN